MSKPRHVYRPPRPNQLFSRLVVGLSGAVFTLFVFILIPLMQRLDNSFENEKPELVAAVQVQEQEEYIAPEEIEEPEPEEEPPPPPPEETLDLDLSLDLPDLGTGGIGKVVLNLSADLAAAASGFDEGEMDAEPTIRSGPNPTIPRAAKAGISSLDEAALKAFRRYKFSPAIKDGAKAQARVSQPFTFRAS